MSFMNRICAMCIVLALALGGSVLSFATTKLPQPNGFEGLTLTTEGNAMKGRQFALGYMMAETSDGYYFTTNTTSWDYGLGVRENMGTETVETPKEYWYVVSKDLKLVKRIEAQDKGPIVDPQFRLQFSHAKAVVLKPTIKNHQVFDGSRCLWTLEKDYNAGSKEYPDWIIHTANQVTRLTSNQGQVYYVVELSDNIPAMKGQSYGLVKWSNGKSKQVGTLLNIEKIDFTKEGKPLILWQHLYQSDGFKDVDTIDTKGKLINLGSDIDQYKKGELIERTCVGLYNGEAIFAIKNANREKVTSSDVRFVAINSSQKVRSLNGLGVHQDYLSWDQFAMTTQGHILVISDKGMKLTEIYQKQIREISLLPKIAGLMKCSEFSDVGTVSVKLPNQSVYTTLPAYLYQGRICICLEDLQLLGFQLKWDNRSRTSELKWQANLNVAMLKPHQFASHNLYMSNVKANIWFNKVCISPVLANADGFYILALEDLTYGGFLLEKVEP